MLPLNSNLIFHPPCYFLTAPRPPVAFFHLEKFVMVVGGGGGDWCLNVNLVKGLVKLYPWVKA